MASINDWTGIKTEEVKEYVEQNGVANIDEFFKKKLKSWQDVEVNIGITGDTGAGKSSYINAIRGFEDDDEGAAEVGVKETTKKPTCYDHPTNPKIKFWDLPGIGTPNYPDLETYCKEVKLETYDAFLIFTSNRFTANDQQLAKKIRSIDKRFFFIRAKLMTMFALRSVKRSNHDPAKWEFAKLTQAILDALPTYQRESLTLSLDILTSLSPQFLQRKVQVLKTRMWMVASLSAAAAVVPIPGVSIAVDLGLIMNEISFYKSQLGLPDEGSPRFAMLSVSTQVEVKALCSILAGSVSKLVMLIAAYASEQAAEEVIRLIPFVGSLVSGAMSFVSTFFFLKHYLKRMEKAAELVIKEAFQNLQID
ncbi:hypothetical protein OS493_036306 [Desmophyllum pertusum]|uniref:IRG-type G domain-containing protein n=1 Tax=Desmophyllum pertusum TaxID=174260 RepID=A0A9W9Z723_9CNID|nr:hypothetical protein OS493_036306 [Desmophyllum pertusum]